MLDLLVVASLGLMAQPSVSSGAELDCSATVRVEVTGTYAPVCGVRIDSHATYVVEADGTETAIGPAVQPWRPSGSRHAGALWVGRRGDNIIITATLIDTTGVMFGRDAVDGGWRHADINCGEYGLQHVYGFSDDNRYAGIGYSHVGQHLFCRLDFETMAQTQNWVEPQDDLSSLEDTQFEFWSDTPEEKHPAEPSPAPSAPSTSPTAQQSCTDYDAAVAAATSVNAQTVQCGVSVDDDQVTIHYPDGRTFPVSGDMFPLGSGHECEFDCDRNDGIAAAQFWAYDAGSSKILGLRNMLGDTLYLISRDESGDRGWYARPLDCGTYGPYIVYPYTPRSEYVFAGYHEEGHVLICALHTHQGALETQWFEEGGDIANHSLSALRISGWNCGGHEEFDTPALCMSIVGPDGNELYRTERIPTGTPPIAASSGPLVLEAVNYPGWFVHRVSGLADMIQNSKPLADEHTRLLIRPGLNGAINAVSFEFIGEDNHYLRHADYRIRVHANDGTDLFAADATFHIRPGLAGDGTVSFESANFPGHFIRHRNAQLWIDASDGSELFAQDASWNVRQ